MPYRDQFSRQAATYARFRPTYPDALFRWIAGQAPDRARAWDVGTGNGQAAVGLAAHFARVVATDASAGQLAHAFAHPGVEYRQAPAERSGLDAGSCDAITVAQALHWFDLDAFYAEAGRVLRPGGVLAVWGYAASEITPEVDRVIRRYSAETVGPYWDARRRLVDAGYRTVPFPFEEPDDVPAFEGETRWRLADALGYLASWSATEHARAALDRDPVDEVRDALSVAWGEAERERLVRWPLSLRVGRVR